MLLLKVRINIGDALVSCTIWASTDCPMAGTYRRHLLLIQLVRVVFLGLCVRDLQSSVSRHTLDRSKTFNSPSKAIAIEDITRAYLTLNNLRTPNLPSEAALLSTAPNGHIVLTDRQGVSGR